MLLQKLVFVAQLGASLVLYLLIGLSVLSIGIIFEPNACFAFALTTSSDSPWCSRRSECPTTT